MIVDCTPDAASPCGGSHRLIVSNIVTNDLCPYDEIGPFNYCDGLLTVGGGCSHYEQDATAGFECVPDA